MGRFILQRQSISFSKQLILCVDMILMFPYSTSGVVDVCCSHYSVLWSESLRYCQNCRAGLQPQQFINLTLCSPAAPTSHSS